MARRNGPASSWDFGLGKILKPLAIIIPLAITGNIAYILIAGKPGLLGSLIDFNIGYLLLAILMIFVPWLTHSARMILWGRVFGRDFRPMQALRTSVAAEVGSAVTPTSVGGGYVKLGFMIGYGFSAAEATLIMMLGTLEDAIFFAVALPIAVARTRAWDNPYLARAVENVVSHWPILLGVAVLAVVVYFIWRKFKPVSNSRKDSRSEKRPGFAARARAGLSKYRHELGAAIAFAARNGKSTLAVCVVLAGAGWVCRYGAISVLLIGLGHQADPVLLFLLQWVIFSSMALVPTPGAVGGAEVAFAVVHENIVPPGLLPLLTGAWRFLTYYLLAMVGALFLAFSDVGFTRGREDKITLVEEQKA